jgi:hypothetical protein
MALSVRGNARAETLPMPKGSHDWRSSLRHGPSGGQRAGNNPFQVRCDLPALVHPVVIGLKTEPKTLGYSCVMERKPPIAFAI